MDYVIFPTKRFRRDVCVIRKPCYTTIEQLLLRENGEETAGIVEKGEEREKEFNLRHRGTSRAIRSNQWNVHAATSRTPCVTKTERGSK